MHALWPISVSRDDKGPDMEKGMHYSINSVCEVLS